MTDEYRQNIREAEEYQDFVCEKLLGYGICVNQFSSKRYQYERGESASGIEIKHDKRFRETGNLYIETEEKANAANFRYVPSGIYRTDNTWLYFVGDYEGAYCFSKKQLQALEKSDSFRRVETPTSRGFLIPVSFLQNKPVYVLRYFSFGQK